MKCVRMVGQGIPVRVSNEDAHQIVEIDKDGEYCSKSFFKQFMADCQDENYVKSMQASWALASARAQKRSEDKYPKKSKR